MKFFIFFALAFATASTKYLYSRSIEVPVLENEGRISNGQTADAAQFKYQVSLDFKVDSLSLWCSGSLITKNWVLSAAHCTNTASSVKVYFGNTIREVSNNSYNIEKSDIITYPVWNPSVLKNDISLIRIPTTNKSSTIGFVKIPRSHINKYVGDSVVISGWGGTGANSTELSINLQYGILEVSPGDVCLEKFGAYYTDDVRICVATPNKVSACHGDSGAPLVLAGTNIQIGVLSYGDIEDCTRRTPLVFTRVSAYRLWIKEFTGIKN